MPNQKEHKCNHDHSQDEMPHVHLDDYSCCNLDKPLFAPQTETEQDIEYIRTLIRILEMDCPVEETLIRKSLAKIAEVKSMDFNLIERMLIVEHEPQGLNPIIDAIKELGFNPEWTQKGETLNPPPESKKSLFTLIVAGIAAASAETVHWLDLPEWIASLLALIAIISCGLTTYKKGWIAIKHGNLNINALMSLAVTGALILRQWPEAAMVMVLFNLAELIEAKALDRARNAISSLVQLAPETAEVLQPDGRYKKVATKEIPLGAIIRIKPGERIGLDGIVTTGYSYINQAPITGESLPINKTIGDSVFAGTMNQTGSFEYQVTGTATQTILAKIIHTIENAQEKKSTNQRFIDKFAQIYTPIVVVMAFLIAILPPLFMDGEWLTWIYKSLVLLVIACPCALVISTPVSIVSGLTAAAHKGILIKGGTYLEKGHKLKWLALDKTGTITHGKPVLTDFKLYSKLNEQQCLALTASLAIRSDHPVSQAIAQVALDKNIELSPVIDFQSLIGRGCYGVIDGKTYYLGNHRLVHEIDCCSPEFEVMLESIEKQGKTVVMLIEDQQILALFAVADTVKETSIEAIQALHKMNIKTIMLTGDNPYTAKTIAEQVKMDKVLGDQLPENKLEVINDLAKEGIVGMVGDGINDAPALVRADIGFAMGGFGSDTAIETADVVLMDDNLNKIVSFIKLSESTNNILLQNIGLALGIKFIFLILTLIGLGTMWMAVFADVGASLLVIGNGLRLLAK